jgi:hypothetical protein
LKLQTNLKGDKMKIIFTNILERNLEEPKPASKFIPDWYKNLESYVVGEKKPNGFGDTTATAKKCMPVFDALTAGYIITSPADVYVSIRDGEQFFEWVSCDLISFHPVSQAPEHPLRQPHSYAKWNNPWAIKTPKGYSVLIVQPFHRESSFTILPGVVDTDTYTPAINFPFVMNDPNFQGLIPAGTPIAQVIPFKREDWKMEIGSEEELKEQRNITQKLQTKFFDRYKQMFWSRKEYK